MPHTYRAFTEAFCEHAHMHKHGWPKGSVVDSWFHEMCGLTGGTYTEIRKGRPVQDKFAIWLVRLLIGGDPRIDRHLKTPKDRAWLEHSRQLLLEFLAPTGIVELKPDLAGAVLQHVCYPGFEAPEGLNVYIDHLRQKAEGYFAILSKKQYPKWVQGCNAKHIPELVEWMYRRIGEQINPAGRMAPSQLRVGAAAYMQVDERDYCQRVMAWNKEPWVVTRAWNHLVGQIGMSIALPVSDATYQAIYDGKLTPYECGATDLVAPSLNIVLEAMVEHPRYIGCPDPNPTESLRVTSVFQIAALARTHRLTAPADVRLLSFAGTHENERRLVPAGFVTYGNFLPRPKLKKPLKIYELKIRVHEFPTKYFPEAAALAHAGQYLPSAPPVDED